MKLCIISEYFDGTGSTPTILASLATHLAERHPELSIDVIASRNEYRGETKRPAREKWGPVNVMRVATPRSNRSSTVLRLATGMAFTMAVLRRLVTGPRYDVLLVVTNPPSLPLAASIYGRLRRVPYVYLIHDLYPDVATMLGVLPESHPATRALTRLQHGWLHAAARVVVLGRDMRGHLVKHYSLSPGRIDVITNWCDPEEIAPRESSAFRARHRLGGVTVLYSGNFGQYQDFDGVLDAAARLRETDPHITIVLVGRGAREAQIRSRVERDELHNVRIFPLVDRDEYPDLLAAADIALVVLASGAEGVGVPSKFYNVLASGRPTVAVVAPHTEVALALDENDCGVQVPPGDSAKLASAISKLASDPARRQRLGANARHALLEHYTLERVGEQFWKVLSETVKAG